MDPYGYVWVPRHMGYRWRPYSDGRWAWTDYGWTWMDNSEWGWIPFHYGRWNMDNDIGWYWVPGTTWGPAWVTWRSNDMYMGWAPLPPGVDLRAGMDFASLRIDVPGSFWIFIGGSHFLDPDVHSYVLPYERNVTIVNNTTVYNNFDFRGDRFVNDGVEMAHIRSRVGTESAGTRSRSTGLRSRAIPSPSRKLSSTRFRPGRSSLRQKSSSLHSSR